MLKQEIKCELCKKSDVELVRLGKSYICKSHMKEPDLHRKIYPTYDITEELIELLNKKEIPAAISANKINDLQNVNTELQNANTTLRNELKNLRTQIDYIAKEKEKTIETLESDRKSIEKLMKMRNISEIEPLLSSFDERMGEIENGMQDGREYLKSEISGLREEMKTLKSAFENNEVVDSIIAEINNQTNEMKQAMDLSQKNTMVEILKVAETTSKQSETTNTAIGEMKAALQNSNVSGSVDKISSVVTELDDKINMMWDTIEHTKAEIKAMVESINAIREPVKAKPEPKKEKLKEKAVKPEKRQETDIRPIPPSITNPLQIEAYKIIQKSPCRGEEITATIGGDKKQRQKVRDALKILRKHGHIILENDIYHLP